MLKQLSETAVTHHIFWGQLSVRKKQLFLSLQLSAYCSSASRSAKTDAESSDDTDCIPL